MTERFSLKASQQGKKLIKEAWNKKLKPQGMMIRNASDMNEIYLREASKILEPDKNWDNASEDHCSISSATLKRFREATQPIKGDTFKAFCQVLGLNWEDVAENEVDANRDLSEAPPPINFYGRTQELNELQQSLFEKGSRLILVHGMGGIGKSALVRNLIDIVADKYNYVIWLSLESIPPFQIILNRLVQFLSKGEQEEGDIFQLMQYLHHQRCLIVLDGWEEIMDNQSEDYAKYDLFIERVAKESHKSCLLLLSRRKPDNITILEGGFVCAKKLLPFNQEDVKEFLRAEGLFGTEVELKRFSERYNNPWILKRIVQSIHNVFNGDISPFINNDEVTTVIDELTTNFLNQQFKKLSQGEINLIYCVGIRRNTALWNQLVQDSQGLLTYQQLFETVNSLIIRHSLMSKNTEDISVVYILEPIILKYSNERFVAENYTQINQIFTDGIINGSELFITHAFITEDSEDEELNQEQMRRIVKPIKKMLLANFRTPQQLENQLKKVFSLLEDKGLSQGHAYQNISRLISVGKQI
jgi:hypothetical protein